MPEVARLGRLFDALSERLEVQRPAELDEHVHERRRVPGHHTCASYLMAAGYTLREIMENLGHSSLAASERYVKLLLQPEERRPADRLNDYVARAAGRAGW